MSSRRGAVAVLINTILARTSDQQLTGIPLWPYCGPSVHEYAESYVNPRVLRHDLFGAPDALTPFPSAEFCASFGLASHRRLKSARASGGSHRWPSPKSIVENVRQVARTPTSRYRATGQIVKSRSARR